MKISVLDVVENEETGENAAYQLFVLFPHCLQNSKIPFDY